jgi:Raf kinase inhibitor-like YbhB/YbcL family protein
MHYRALFLAFVASASMSLYAKKQCSGSIVVTSFAFRNGDPIPTKYTCTGLNISPQLALANVPCSAQSLVIIVDDPDAPAPFPNPFVHWIVYDLPVVCYLQQAVNLATQYPTAKLGINDFGHIAYDGPCPPGNDPKHHYRFTVYALDVASLDLPVGATKAQVLDAMAGHVLLSGRLVGTYRRQQQTT